MLKAVNIHKTYRNAANPLRVLKGVNAEVKAGEILTIIGPSGAGKSTLLHVLAGLDRPDEGTVTLQGKDVYKLTEPARAYLRNTKIGFVFQFYHLLPEFTALENVILPVLIKGGPKRISAFTEMGMALLDQVGLRQRCTHRPQELSGGEQQRIAIARALINQPEVIFCDEPTGNLDSQSAENIIELLKKVNQNKQQTIVIVTHDEQIARISHRTMYMRDGILNEKKGKL